MKSRKQTQLVYFSSSNMLFCLPTTYGDPFATFVLDGRSTHVPSGVSPKFLAYFQHLSNFNPKTL
jgi:hypothetical protein